MIVRKEQRSDWWREGHFAEALFSRIWAGHHAIPRGAKKLVTLLSVARLPRVVPPPRRRCGGAGLTSSYVAREQPICSPAMRQADVAGQSLSDVVLGLLALSA